jgi:hypothetical protein
MLIGLSRVTLSDRECADPEAAVSGLPESEACTHTVLPSIGKLKSRPVRDGFTIEWSECRSAAGSFSRNPDSIRVRRYAPGSDGWARLQTV